MELGLFMMPLHPPHRSLADSYDRDLETLVHADRLGYHEAWIGEHLTSRWENAPAPDLLIAKALAMTQNIMLCTGVNLLALHDPLEVAHRIAMLDHLARGRFYWGIGLRGIPTDMELFSLDPKEGLGQAQGQEVVERALEVLELVLALWNADAKFTFNGKYFHVDAPELNPTLGRGLYMKPFQRPHPPIGIAGSTPGSQSLRMAGERGWIPMSGTNLFPHQLRDQWELIENSAASANRKASRSEWRIVRDVYVGETPEKAREEARAVLGKAYVGHLYPVRKHAGILHQFKVDPTMPDEAVDVDYMMENAWIVGDPQECADKLRKLYQEVGGFGTLMIITYDSEDPSWHLRSMQLLADEVRPQLPDISISE